MYKKHIDGFDTFKRSDKGDFLIEKIIDSFSPETTIVALIARLKSKRLKNKVLLKFSKNELIVDLYDRISNNSPFKVVLATSFLKEDDLLANLFEKKSFPVFRGDDISIIDRMLRLAFIEKASSIFRVTGDNPFTDPYLMNEMSKMLNKHKLDYVRVNNAPFGVSAELFSTKYLWKLYLKLESTEYSEYLSWYVLNDKDVKMGSIDIVTETKTNVNLSVDYEKDYQDCKKLLQKIDKNFSEITLNDIFKNISVLKEINLNSEIKLPKGNKIKLINYLKNFKDKTSFVREKIIVK
jgi:spore coat polysaccharide biosynthesis protein SpsF